MVNKCCIPNCKTKYKRGNKHVPFSFPKNEVLKKKWTRADSKRNFLTNQTFNSLQTPFYGQGRMPAAEYDNKLERKYLRPNKKGNM